MIPLEDNFNDILGKAQRGLKLTPEQLAARSGVTPADVTSVIGGVFDEGVVRKLAPVLHLGVAAIVASGRKAWRPGPIQVDGLAQFNTVYEDMTVNSYLVWDTKTKQAAAFDTGSDCSAMLKLATGKNLKISLILLTHTHGDHIIALERLKKETGAPAYVCKLEPTDGAEQFEAGKIFKLGGLTIETRQTTGHSKGAISYVVTGLERRIAVVGDSMFAGSMGGGMVSYEDALRNNREKILTLPDETVVCPGHGPLTTVGEEKQHNPFFATK